MENDGSNKTTIIIKTVVITTIVGLILNALIDEFKENFFNDNSIGFKVLYAPNKLIIPEDSTRTPSMKNADDSQEDMMFIWLIKSDKTLDKVKFRHFNSIAPLQEGYTSVTKELLSDNNEELKLEGNREYFQIRDMKVRSNTPYTFAFAHAVKSLTEIVRAQIETRNYVSSRSKVNFPVLFGKDQQLAKELNLVTNKEKFEYIIWGALVGSCISFVVFAFVSRLKDTAKFGTD